MFWVWLLFMVKGCEMNALLPLWGGFDEWLHYSYTAYLSREWKVPDSSVLTVPEEVYKSLAFSPAGGSVGFPYYDLWQKDESRLKKYMELSQLKNSADSPFVAANWQSQHPPFYYALLVPVYKFICDWSLLRSVQALRVFSLLLASFALLPLYRLFRTCFSLKATCAGLLLFVYFPSTYILLGHLTNDSLAFPILSGIIYFVVEQARCGIKPGTSFLLGLFIGLGLLTKLYVMIVFPSLLIVWTLRMVRDREFLGKNLLGVLIASGVMLVIGLPWFLHNIRVCGHWNPTVHSVVTKNLGLVGKLKFLPLVDWKSFVYSMTIGAFWSGNWSFITFPAPVYKCVLLGVGLWSVFYLYSLKLMEKTVRNQNLILISFVGSFLLALANHQLEIRAAGNFDSTGGWYWTVLLPIVILMVFYSFQVVPELLRRRAYWAAIFAVLFFHFWGYAGLLLPYYSGYWDKSSLALLGFHVYPIGSALTRISILNDVPLTLFSALLFMELFAWIGLARSKSLIYYFGDHEG